MKKLGLLSSLNQVKAELKLAQKPFDDEYRMLTAMRITLLLMDYINDAEIRKAIDEITF